MKNPQTSRQSGQILIMAVMILSVLLVLGFVFAVIISQNITSTVRSHKKTLATQLSEGGVQYVHGQLLYSELGGDWRPARTLVSVDREGNTKDPDAFYLRRGSGKNDQGGPDGLGPYSRMFFEKGRALIRVRLVRDQQSHYQEEEALKKPSFARGYLLIESVGRSGFINPKDPTTLLQEFIPESDYERLKNANAAYKGETRKKIAFASIGFLESARYITNKYHRQQPAEMGSFNSEKEGLGAYYKETPVQLTSLLGSSEGSYPLWCNGNLRLYGKNEVLLNASKNEIWGIAGKLELAEGAALKVKVGSQEREAYSTENNQPGWTLLGSIRDHVQGFDSSGYIRGIRPKEAPSLLTLNPETRENRYILSTRKSGPMRDGKNIGEYGYGSGIYIDCSEKSSQRSLSSRFFGDPLATLAEDWFYPNNPESSGWQGPFYCPVAPLIEFKNNAIEITRDPRSKKAFWLNPDNNQPVAHRAKFNLDMNSYINNDVYTDPVIGDVPFNGVIFCEGDVRVKGVIPADVHLTIVSMGTIYIDGSITKGVVKDGVLLDRQSRSSLMLMAKEHVALNTTQFFSIDSNQGPLTLTKINDQSAFELSQPDQNLNLSAQMLLESSSNNPQDWKPYALEYQTYQALSEESSEKIIPWMLFKHGPSNPGPTYIYLGIAPENNAEKNLGWYLFFEENNFVGPSPQSLWGMQQFKNDAFSLYPSELGAVYQPENLLFQAQSSERSAGYAFGTSGPTKFQIRLGYPVTSQTKPVQNYALARMAIVPHDIRIEASIYAEEGSFFVIPGTWWNENPSDNRTSFDQKRESFKTQNAKDPLKEASGWRLKTFGSVPETPFYHEPLNIRIMLVGSISENRPAPMSYQAEWQRKWGWMPGTIGATGKKLPKQHVPKGYVLDQNSDLVPNLMLVYDPILYQFKTSDGTWIRTDEYGEVLPPMPRLPVSPTLLYEGEVSQ